MSRNGSKENIIIYFFQEFQCLKSCKKHASISFGIFPSWRFCYIDGDLNPAPQKATITSSERSSVAITCVTCIWNVYCYTHLCLANMKIRSFILRRKLLIEAFRDSKFHGANTGPTWGRQDPGGPHVGPMNLANWVLTKYALVKWVIIWVRWMLIASSTSKPWVKQYMYWSVLAFDTLFDFLTRDSC